MDILPVIVLYKQQLDQCRTWKSVLKDYPGQIFVFDNSPEAGILPPDSRIIYRHAPDNPGISKAYNCAAEYALKNGFNWLLLLDQDTCFDFPFSRYTDAIAANPEIRIFAPSVVTEKNIPLSPINLHTLFPTAQHLAHGSYALSDYAPINSGTLIKLDAFYSCGKYNEAVFLDHSDYDFMEQAAAQGKRFVLLDARAVQDFSGDEPDKNKQFFRFVLFLKSARFCRWRSFKRKLKMDFFVFCRALVTGKALQMRCKCLKAWIKIFVFKGDTP